MNFYFNPALSCKVINFPLPLENGFNLIKGFLFAVKVLRVFLKIFCLMLVPHWIKLDLIMKVIICNLLIMFYHHAN
jgi:hypothetical protein